MPFAGDMIGILTVMGIVATIGFVVAVVVFTVQVLRDAKCPACGSYRTADVVDWRDNEFRLCERCSHKWRFE